MLEAFHVKYRGLYGGGNAIVLAPSALKALDLVDEHHLTVGFIDVTIERLGVIEDNSQVLFNANGDY